MKTTRLPALMAALAMGLAASATAADTAIVKQDRLNVRGQATINSETVTQLRKGETVVVHEIITQKQPKEGEPARWAKISLPSNTPVWISAQFVTNSQVNATKLNIRSGPGERFSILGTLEKGARVSEIRTLDDWMEIISPTNTVAFVAAEYLDIQIGTPPPATPELAKPEPVPAPAPPPPVTTVETVKPAPAPAVAVDNPPPPAPKPVEPPPAAPVVPTTPAPAPSSVVKIEPAPPIEAPGAPANDEPLPKRIVTREGVVRRSLSIQAPTDYRLVEDESGRTINYLYTGETGLELKWFSGKKIRISGEEAIDKRWPNTPMIEIRTLQPLN